MDNFDEIPEPTRYAWYLDYSRQPVARDHWPPGEAIANPTQRVDDDRWSDIVLSYALLDVAGGTGVPPDPPHEQSSKPRRDRGAGGQAGQSRPE